MTDLDHWIDRDLENFIDQNGQGRTSFFGAQDIETLANKGLYSLSLVAQDSGADLMPPKLFNLFTKLAYRDVSLAAYLLLHNSLTKTIANYYFGKRKDVLLTKLRSGAWHPSFALTEESSASDLAAISTIYRKRQRDYVLTGRKRWIGLAELPGPMLVVAKDKKGNSNVFLTDKTNRDIIVHKRKASLGLQSFPQNDLTLKNVRVDHDDILGSHNMGNTIIYDTLQYTRYGLVAVCLGGMKRAIDLSSKFSATRQISTGLLCNNLLFRRMISEALHKMEGVRLASEYLGALDQSDSQFWNFGPPLLKLFASHYAFEIADCCLQSFGASGYEETVPIVKLFKDLRAFRILEGSNELLASYLQRTLFRNSHYLSTIEGSIAVIQSVRKFEQALTDLDSENRQCFAHEISEFYFATLILHFLDRQQTPNSGVLSYWRNTQIRLLNTVSNPENRTLLTVPDSIPQISANRAHSVERSFESEIDSTATFCDLFNQVVLRHPNNIALRDAQNTIAYADLQTLVRKLTGRLAAIGIGLNDIVAVVGEKQINHPVLMLAIFQVGGCYLPINRRNPSKRIQAILHQAAPRLVIYLDNSAEISFEHRFTKGLLLEDLLKELPDTNYKLPSVTPNHRAYVIFTSGSTGMPKGVVIAHRGILNFVSEQSRVCKLTGTSILFQFASVDFDMAIGDYLSALGSGAQLYIPTSSEVTPNQEFSQLLVREGITHLAVTPSFLSKIQPFTSPSLNTILCAGESISPSIVTEWCDKVRLINAYGPSEATIWATYKILSRGDSPSIGKPIRNMNLSVLIPGSNQPVNDSEIGELVIESESVAEGYLGQSEDSKSAFFTKNNIRCYRTGDLVRYNRDGDLEYHGRIDGQVKINGQRVELSEIENCICKNPLVSSCRVCLVPFGKSDVLVAAIVLMKPDRSHRVDFSKLAEILPRHMVPQNFVFLDDIPLSRNGKTDFSRLRELMVSGLSRNGTSPRDLPEISNKILQIWESLLNIRHFDLQSTFYQLGGNSLTLAAMIEEIEVSLGITIQDDAVDTSCTVDSLSDLVRRSPTEECSVERIQIGLFIFPGGIGNGEYLTDLTSEFDHTVEVHLVQYEQFIEEGSTFDRLIEQIQDANQFDRYEEIICIGHSFGGIIAFEISSRLEIERSRIHLIALDTVLLGCHPSFTIHSWGEAEWLRFTGELNSGVSSSMESADCSDVHSLHEFLKRASAIQDDSALATTNRLIAKSRRVLEMYSGYTPARKFEFHLVLVKACSETCKSSIFSSLRSIAESSEFYYWDRYTLSVDLISFDEDHFSIAKVKSLRKISRIVKALVFSD